MRLIDADALMKEFAKFVAPSNRSDFVQPPNWNDAVSLLGSAPTIDPKGELISRQALKNTLTDWQMEYAEKDKDTERFETLGAVIDLVEQMPTIEPKKVVEDYCIPRNLMVVAAEDFRLQKKGKWIEREKYRTTRDGIFHTYRFKVCSECGRGSGRRMNRPTRFCPNCGARMERSEE